MSFTFRARVTALVSASVLSLTLVATPLVVVAQDTPEDAIADVFAKVVDWRFAEIADSFCATQADAAEALDLESWIGEFTGDLGGDFIGAFISGLDVETLRGAIAVEVDDLTVEMIEQGDSAARARILATLAIRMDSEGVRAIVDDLLGSLGQSEAQAAIIDQAIETISAELEAQAIDEEVDLLIEDGVWKVCSPLALGGSGEAGTIDQGVDADAASEEDA